MALVAPVFVPFALGDRWGAAVLPLQLLSVHVTIRCVTALFGQALLAIGETRQSMRVGFWQLATLPPLFVIGATLGGTTGVALVWLVAHPVVAFPSLVLYVAHRVGLGLGHLADAIWPPIVGTAIMSAAVAVTHVVLPPGTGSGLALGAMVTVGGLTYPAAMLLLFPSRVRTLVRLLRASR
jgi:O-antigen/teichoic acid export membrane protein